MSDDKKEEKQAPTPSWRTRKYHDYSPTGTFDYRTGRAFKRNSRDELVPDEARSPIAKGTDFDPFTGK